MTHFHLPVLSKPKWFKVTIDRSRIVKFLYEAYLGNNSETPPDGDKSKKNQLPSVNERL